MSDAVAENTDYLWDTKIYGSPIGGGQVWDYSACNSMCIYNSKSVIASYQPLMSCVRVGGCHSWTYDTDDLCQLYSSYDPPTGYAADYVSGTFVSASNRFYRGTSPKPR